MDKLIEAAQGLIALGPPERAQDQLWSTWQKRVKAYNLLVAAVVRAPESAPVSTTPIPFEDWWASQGRCIDPDTEDVPWFDKRKGLAEAAYDAGQSSVKFAQFYSHTKPASAPQLDAEDPAEPVEDVPPGYVKLNDVEKAIRAVWKEHYHSQAVWSKEEFLSKLMARLAPKPEPSQSAVIDTLRSEDFQRANACIECGTLVVHQELRAKWHAALVDRSETKP